jgi:putative solute:sodium symporter small subunit
MQDKSEQLQSIWLLLGPLIAVLTLFVAFFSASPLQRDLFGFTLIGIPLCWFLKKQGSIITCLFLSLAIAYLALFRDKEFELEQLALGVSLGLSFVITARCKNEIDTFFQNLNLNILSGKDQTLALESKVKAIQDELAQERQHLAEKKELIQSELDQSEKNRKQLLKEAEKIRQQLLNANKRIEEQSATILVIKETLVKKDNELKVLRETFTAKEAAQMQKLESINDELVGLKQKCESYVQDSLIQNQQIIELNQKIQLLKPYESLHKQLRQQFDEKAATLTKTRQDLFKANEKIEALSLDIEEKTKYFPNEFELALIRELNKLEKQMLRMEKNYTLERSLLEDIILYQNSKF